jgi:hypothetical protein
MPERKPDKSYTDRKIKCLADSRAELALPRDEWERLYGAWPGESYRRTMEAQIRYCISELQRYGIEAK